MTLLTTLCDAALKIGIEKPNSIIGNTAIEVMELLAFCQEEVRELTRRHGWQALRKEATFATLAAEEQAALPADFDRFVNQTFWNRSRKHMLYGPLSSSEWQYTKNWAVSPVTDSFTVRGKKILIAPIPPAGETIAYEYISKYGVLEADGTTYKEKFSVDSDTTVLYEDLVELGTIVRFKLAKGLDATSDVAKYETQVALRIGQEAPKKIAIMSSVMPRYSVPNAVIPDGDWSL